MASYNYCGKTDGNDDDEKGKAQTCNKISFFFAQQFTDISSMTILSTRNELIQTKYVA